MRVFAVVTGQFIDDELLFLRRKHAKAVLQFERKRLKIPKHDLTVRIATLKVHEKLPAKYRETGG